MQKIEFTLPKTAIPNCSVISFNVSDCHSTLPEHILIIDSEVHPNNPTKSELVPSVPLKSAASNVTTELQKNPFIDPTNSLFVSDSSTELVKIQTEALRHELARSKLETQQWVMENETLKFQLSLLLNNHKEVFTM